MGYEIDGGNQFYGGGQWQQVDDMLSGYRVGYAPPQQGHGYRPLPAPPAYRGLPQRGYAPQAFAAPHYIGQTQLQQTAPQRDGQLVLPMSSSGTIAASAAASITARPQIAAYRPERIVVANSIAAFFTMSDIKVGNTSQLVQAGTLPAEAFIQGAFGVEMRMDTVQTAMDFVFNVNNIDATTARSFLSVVFGRAVY